MNSLASLLYFGPHHGSPERDAYFTTSQAYRLDRVDHHPARAILLCHCLIPRRCRNIHLLSIAYDFCPRLRPRLTLRGRTFLRKPLAFDGEDSHLTLATHTGILSSMQSTVPLDTASTRIQCSSTTPVFTEIRRFGGTFEPRTFSAHNHSTSELLRTL